LTVPKGNYIVEFRSGIYPTESKNIDLTKDVKLNLDLGENIKLYKNFKNGTVYLALDKKYYTITDEKITLEEAKKVISGETVVNTSNFGGGAGANAGQKNGIIKELNAEIKLGKSKFGYYLVCYYFS
jgi:hypothetical protein